VEATPSVVATTSLNTTAINKWKKWVHFELEYFHQKKKHSRQETQVMQTPSFEACC